MTGSEPRQKPGDQIGKYAVMEQLDRTGRGEVYVAEHRQLKSKVAIKIIGQRDPQTIERVRREAQTLASMRHPCIADLHDMDEHEGHLYLVMEYVQGRALRDMLASNQRLSIGVALRLMISVADALAYVHGLGIVHRNVRPGSIMVSSGGNPFLFNFVLSHPRPSRPDRQEDDLDASPYLPPEALKGDLLDARADLWALGMTLHELITGDVLREPKAQGEAADEPTSATGLAASALHNSAPERVISVIERCLQSDREKRYQSATDVRRDIEAALAHLESADAQTLQMAPLRAGGKVLLNVEYQEPGIPGAYREYQIEGEIGQGSYGVVYRATDLTGQRPVALKILRHQFAGDERAVARFRREASLLSRLNHPNVVRVHNFGRCGVELFIVMEFLDGLNLREVARRGHGLSIEQAAAIAVQVLSGLAEIHAGGAIHRDVKPANILLQQDRAVLMDLGMAHVSDATNLTMSHETCGTPQYLAPEQARGERVMPQCDLYAAGVVLYELLTGRCPHQADTPIAMAYRIASEEPDPITAIRSDLPPRLGAFVMRVLKRNPTDRFASAHLARQALLASVDLEEGDVQGLQSTIHQAFQ